MNKVKFFKLNSNLPKFKISYEGFFVLDENDNFYIGTNNGWKKILNEDDLSGINEILEDILGDKK